MKRKLAWMTIGAILGLTLSIESGTSGVTVGGKTDTAFVMQTANQPPLHYGFQYDALPPLYQVSLNDPTLTQMVEVEGGTLAMTMGTVTVDTFYIGETEVTWGEWVQIRDLAAANDYDIGSRGIGCSDDHPVHSVSWFDVVKWCNAKSETEGLVPAFSYNGEIYRSGEPADLTMITQDFSASGYRLPQEFEWEFAARGGIRSNGYTFAGSNDPNEVGWYRDNSSGAECDLWDSRGTWPVGQKAPNELGLYDMSGNVWEFCWDYNGSRQNQIRGGSWGGHWDFTTVSTRSWATADYRHYSYGFRLVRSAVQKMYGPYAITEGYCDTTPWLGWLWVENDPWVWCVDLNHWLYCPGQYVGDGGTWVFPLEQDDLQIIQVDGTDWGYSFAMDKWLYLTASGWVYML